MKNSIVTFGLIAIFFVVGIDAYGQNISVNNDGGDGTCPSAWPAEILGNYVLNGTNNGKSSYQGPNGYWMYHSTMNSFGSPTGDYWVVGKPKGATDINGADIRHFLQSNAATPPLNVRFTSSSNGCGYLKVGAGAASPPPASTLSDPNAGVVTETSMNLSWSQAVGTTGYNVYVSTNSSFTAPVAGLNPKSVPKESGQPYAPTTTTISGLTRGTTYYIRIRGYSGAGEGPYSNTVSATTIPGAPVATAATAVTDTTFRANWNAASGANSYKLYVSKNSSFTSHVSGYNGKGVGSQTYSNVTGLEVNTTYYYRLKANGTFGESGYSNTITGTTDLLYPKVQFTSTASNGDESTSSIGLQVGLSFSTGSNVMVDYSVSGTASGGGTDFTLANGTLTINAGGVNKNITINSIIDDVLDEYNETLIVTLSTPVKAWLGANAVHTYTINDNDQEPTVSFTSASQSSANESGTMTITVQLSAVSGKNVAIPFTVNASSTATGSGADYTISGSPVTISVGDTAAAITITISDDVMGEGNETVITDMGTPENAGKGAITSHTATIVDDDDYTPPNAVCKHITVYLDASGNTTIVGSDLDGGSSDDYGIASFSATKTSFSCADLGSNSDTLTVTDGNSNSANCVTTVTVLDTISPTITCPGNQTENPNASCQFTLPDYTSLATATDNCDGVPTVTQSPVAGTVISDTTTIIFTAYDGIGNTSICTFDVIFNDTIAPNAVCQNINVYLDGSGNGSIAAEDLDGGSTDNCSGLTLSASQTSFSCSDLGPNNVTLTAVDGNTNSANCVAVVTVIDTIAPTASCQNITTYLDGAGNASITAGDIDNGSFDGCESASTTLCNDLFFSEYIEGSSSNKALEIYNPSLLPINLTDYVVYCNNNGSPIPSDSLFLQGILLAGDVFVIGNPSANSAIQAELDTAHTLTFYNGDDAIWLKKISTGDTIDIIGIIGVDPGSEWSVGTGSTTNFTLVRQNTVHEGIINWTLSSTQWDIFPIDMVDSLGSHTMIPCETSSGVTLSISSSTFTCANLGPNNVTLTVDDGNGNTANCIAVVTVIDTIPPMALCTDTTVYLDVTGNVVIDSTFIDSNSTDSCGILTMALDSSAFSCENVGSPLMVTLTVTDMHTNSASCTSTVTVMDTVSPVALCADTTVYLDATGNINIDSTFIDNGSSDACGILTMALNSSAFSCENVGSPLVVTLTVTDMHTNSASCTSTVIVMDTISPTALCRDTTVYLDATGNANIDSTFVDNSSSDACGIATMTLDVSSYSCSEVGTNPVVLTVSDVNGNSSICTSTVTVIDTVPPMALCTDTTVYLNATGNITIDSSFIDMGSNDACGIAGVALNVYTFDGSDVGSNPVVLLVTDVNGNVATCTSTVTIFDTIPPEANCQNIGIALDEEGRAKIYPAFIDNGSSDACGIVSYSLDITKFNCLDVGKNTVVMSVKDVGGNVSTCSATVTVVDNFMPPVSCKNIEVLLDTEGIAEIDVSMIANETSNICGIAGMELSQSIFTGADLGENTVTLSVTGKGGNSSSCEATVTVKDDIAPVAKCNSISIWIADSATYELSVEDIVLLSSGSSDNASPYDSLHIEVTPTVFNCSSVGDSVEVEVIVSDEAGNESTCEAFVSVNYSVDTEIDDIEVSLAAGVCETAIDYPEVFASESCASFTQLAGLGADTLFPVGTSVETWEVSYSDVSDTVSFSVIVSSENVVPTLDTIAAVTVNEDETPLTIILSGITGGADCVAQTVTVSATNTNTTLVSEIEVVYTAGDTTGILNLTLAANQNGSDNITVVVEDSEGATSSQSLALIVNPVNDAPFVVTPLPDGAVNAGHPFVIPLSGLMGVIFDDVDDDMLAFDVMQEGTDSLPTWAGITDDILTALPMLADTGSYSFVVTATDAAGAMAADTFMLIVEGSPTAVNEIDAGLFEVSMYPNPSKGEVHLKINSSEIMDSEVSIRSVTGSEVFRKKYKTADQINIDLSEQVSGMYLVVLKQGDKTAIKKLILERK